MLYICSQCSSNINVIVHPKAILYKDEYPKIHREDVFFYGENPLCSGCNYSMRAGYKKETDNYLKSIGAEIKPRWQKFNKKKHFS